MTTDEALQSNASSTRVTVVPPVELYSGDRMSREEFHRAYKQTPEDFRAELIGGTVYVSSPLKRSHGKPHLHFSGVLAAYESRTQGMECSENTTVLLGELGEPQPDLYARILPEYGGQSRTEDDYVVGAPEFIGEIANSSYSIDLHAKKDDYTKYGVLEYLVVCVREQAIRWFDLAAGLELHADAEGIYRIKALPGLWINGPALLAQDYAKLMETLENGLATPDHAAFVRQLATRKADVTK